MHLCISLTKHPDFKIIIYFDTHLSEFPIIQMRQELSYRDVLVSLPHYQATLIFNAISTANVLTNKALSLVRFPNREIV